MHQANALESVQHMMRLQDAEASMSNIDFAEAAVVRRVFPPRCVTCGWADSSDPSPGCDTASLGKFFRQQQRVLTCFNWGNCKVEQFVELLNISQTTRTKIHHPCSRGCA
jgi:hypothetical protein